MKKTKILTVLGVLLALGITACGGNKTSSKSEEKSSQSQPASSVEPAPASTSQPASTPDTSAPAQDSSSSSSAVAHVHVWALPNKDELMDEFSEVDPEPSCTEAGVRTWYCECGETKTEAVKKLGHEWGNWTEKTAATCEQDGVEERECSRCHEKEEQPIKAAHKWGEAQTVAAGAENQVSYKLQTCSVCGAYKATIKATDCSFVKGSIKSSTPSGYFKLNSKNDKAIWRFNVDLPEGKNLVGVFNQPSLVICDISTLSTLPEDVFADGMAEAVKTGILCGNGLFELCEEYKEENLLDIISSCMEYTHPQ